VIARNGFVNFLINNPTPNKLGVSPKATDPRDPNIPLNTDPSNPPRPDLGFLILSSSSTL
jgi:hypothetical protein